MRGPSIFSSPLTASGGGGVQGWPGSMVGSSGWDLTVWEAVGAWDPAVAVTERSYSSSCNAFFILSLPNPTASMGSGGLGLRLPMTGGVSGGVLMRPAAAGWWGQIFLISLMVLKRTEMTGFEPVPLPPPLSFSTQVSYLLLGDQTSLSKHLFSSPRCQRRARRHLDRMFVAVRLRDQHPDSCKMPGQFRIRFFPH
jgi:hypothetical protein